ncbi:glycoside hydrolase family 43 protein [Natronospora cellulosivora (SeqCode)]
MKMEAYLFTHFAHGNTPDSEQIYFSISKDGMEWKALNNSEPIFRSEIGEKGLRDPFIIRSAEGDKFYMIATDLSIHYNGDWERAQTAGSKSIMVWESPDLVNWSEQRMVKVAKDDAGCTWAPEVVYDKDAGDYMVFWASKVGSDDFAKQRIYCSKTNDFINFSEPVVYIEKDSHIIDTTFIENEGKYYRFSKDESYKSIIMELGDTLMGDFNPVESFTLLNVQGYEGPICFKLNGEDKWCLLLDNYAKAEGYKAFLTSDLKSGHFKPIEGEFKTPYLFRHGGVIPITLDEYNRLLKKYGK